MLLAQILLFLGLCMPSSLALNATVCDFSKPLQMGILQFSPEDSRPDEDHSSSLTLTNTPYTPKDAPRQNSLDNYVPDGRSKKKNSVDFFGLVVIVTDKVALDTSFTECQIMYESHRCNDQLMVLKENKYVFDEEPSDSGHWLQTIITEKVNCVLEKVPLYQQTEGRTASATTGGLMHNHLTLICDKTYTQTSDPKARVLESGIAALKYIGIPGKYRLTDDDNELVFNLMLNPRCIPTHQKFARKTGTFDVIGQPDIYVVAVPIKPTNISLKEIHKHTPKTDSVNVTANLQYMHEQIIDHENELAHAIAFLYCDSRKAAHERAISTAQYIGWLAASQLNLPACAKLNAFGKTAVMTTCTPHNVTFDIEITSCGPQQKYQNFTINLDGWELVPFSPCYWTKSFMNFNNKPFGYRNNTWVPIEAKIVLPLQTLAPSFRYDEVKYFDYAHQSNPAYSDTIIDHMNIMADIAAAMNEHSAGNYASAHIPSTSTVLGTVADAAAKTSWLDQLTTFLYIGAVIIIAVVSIRVCIACGCCGLIWKFCSLLRIPTRTAGNRDNDIELGITERNPTVRGMM
ncbi:hypothetical protein DAPPUDRAFT_116561 [Daphnia pulex]|uniref:Uncharacterized protein n=1 Tax=Daphnia pulex TaxID=6669 RepID=E9HPR4_DAPPU|nr:hypothetical protein DAPPUDRAFT_116561 [Daphnia pulex]|eukprot:EFX66266.1 hypothetical protein DAPPUDRAFT_116561 [Daphnia pulex]